MKTYQETTVLPYPTEASPKMEVIRVQQGANLSHIAYVIHPSNSEKRIDEIVTHWHGKKYVHRYTGDVRRAMQMIQISLYASGDFKFVNGLLKH